MINKILNSYFFYRFNLRIPIVEFLNFYNSQNSPSKKWLQKKMTFFRRKSSFKKKDGILLVQRVTDYEYTLKLAAASSVYADKNNLDVYFYNPYWMKWIGWTDKIESLYMIFFDTSLKKMYNSFGKGLLFDSQVKFNDQRKIQLKLKEILATIHTPEDLMKITIDDIFVGDLINDTYLRFFNKPTIEAIDNDLNNLIEITLNIFYSFQTLLVKKNIEALFTTYTTYIGHGLAVRLCLDKDIPVYAFGIYDDVFQKVNKTFPVQTLHYWEYEPNKDISSVKLAEAEKRFTFRFTGGLDSAISYMKQSSFQDMPIDDELKNKFLIKTRNVIIYAHDLFDSPHVYRHLQFQNLFLYLKQTIENIHQCTTTNFWIKVHPNSKRETKNVIKNLIEEINKDNIRLLDETVSNIQVVKLNPDLIVTARGTVALEMAYFEIPVVALYDNPYIQFNFAHTCYDLETYYSIIRGEMKPNIDFNKKLIYSYYYQAYMENFENVDIETFNILQNFKGEKFSDDYIDMLKQNENLFFSEKFLDNYRRKFFQLN